MMVTCVISGFKSDIDNIIDRSVLRSIEIKTIDEATVEAPEIYKSDVLVFLFSRDTTWSTTLLSWFSWINYKIEAQEKVVVVLEEAVEVSAIFSFLKGLPILTPRDFKELAKKWSEESFSGS